MKKLVITGCILTLLWACRTGKPAMVSSKDSLITRVKTEYVEVYKDSLVVIPADSSWFYAMLECDSNGKVLLKQILDYKAGNHMKVPEVKIISNRLQVNTWTDSFNIYLRWKEHYGYYDSAQVHEKEKIITLPPERINYTTGWQSFMIKSGKAAWILFLLFATYKVFTYRLTIIQKIRKWVA
ncbi:MAG: hypothetical protein Q8K66_13135 [Sediminibacterium sp.]|nr:hypothetical protein [Sediminibacterium sp.]MDP3128821.1 hypothetical protein [Sediminibacterium sp.]